MSTDSVFPGRARRVARPSAKPDLRRPRRAAVVGGVGCLIEGYDFSSYGYLSVYIAPLFFPNSDPVVSLLLTLLVFATAYVARPLGGIVFGLIGDRVNRGLVLMITIFAMGVASTLIGILPTHQDIGLIATILLILVRLIQGLSMGAEVAGATTYVSEAAPVGNKARFGAFNNAGANLGFGLAAATSAVTSTVVGSEQMAEWGWRVPFLLCLPLTIVTYVIRKRFTSHAAESVSNDQRPGVLSVVRDGWVPIVKSAALSTAVNGTAYFGLTYISIHLIQFLGYPNTAVFWVTTSVISGSAVLMLLAGRLGDRIDVIRLGTIGLIGYFALAWLCLLLMQQGNLALAAIAYGLLVANTAMINVTGYVLIPQLFPRHIRFTGTGVGFNIGVVIAGGAGPAICLWLVERTGNTLAPAFFVMAASLIGLVALWVIARGARPGQREH